jgi:hypothetical protein
MLVLGCCPSTGGLPGRLPLLPRRRRRPRHSAGHRERERAAAGGGRRGWGELQDVVPGVGGGRRAAARPAPASLPLLRYAELPKSGTLGCEGRLRAAGGLFPFGAWRGSFQAGVEGRRGTGGRMRALSGHCAREVSPRNRAMIGGLCAPRRPPPFHTHTHTHPSAHRQVEYTLVLSGGAWKIASAVVLLAAG